MKKIMWMLFGCCLCWPAHAAPKEQWLQYNTSREGRGYRWLQLQTNAPANVTFPKLTTAAYYGRWETPMDASGGRWICIDRSGKTQYDRLWVDANGNGKLDDETPLALLRSDPYSTYFIPAKLVFKGEDGPVTYHLAVRFSKYQERDASMLVSSAGWYTGMVDLGGKKVKAELVDANVNGTFNDATGPSGDRDRVTLGTSRYLGSLVEVDKQFYKIEVARDGAFLKVQKAEGVTLGKAHLPEVVGNFEALSDVGHFTRKPVKGEITLPVGEYRILDWEVKRKDTHGTEWTMSGYNFPETARFTVTAAATTDVKLGEPIKVSVDPTELKGSVNFSMRFVGVQGEQISFSKGGTTPKGPQMLVANADRSFSRTNSFEFG